MTDYEMVPDFCGKKDSLIVLVIAATTNYIFYKKIIQLEVCQYVQSSYPMFLCQHTFEQQHGKTNKMTGYD